MEEDESEDFKFDFGGDEKDDIEELFESNDSLKSPIKSLQSIEYVYTPKKTEDIESWVSKNTVKNIKFRIISLESIQTYLMEKSEISEQSKEVEMKYIGLKNQNMPKKFQKLDCDVIEKKYEGGFKMWECSFDLAEFMLFNYCKNNDLSKKTILEIGCGYGIPGIACLMKGSKVDFQDYNSEVLELVTVPNVFLNCGDVYKKCNFFYGDWGLLKDQITCKYDVIIGAEILYNKKSFVSLVGMMKSLLKKGGVFLISSKSDYFGFGGTIFDFEKIIQKEKNIAFKIKKTIQNGVSNIRKIIELSFTN